MGRYLIDLIISKDKLSDAKIILKLLDSDEFGATYSVSSKDFIFSNDIWLCNVTKYVFGEFPELLYIKY